MASNRTFENDAGSKRHVLGKWNVEQRTGRLGGIWSRWRSILKHERLAYTDQPRNIEKANNGSRLSPWGQPTKVRKDARAAVLVSEPSESCHKVTD